MPDFVTTIDPLELIFEKVAKVTHQVNDVSLICMSWASSKMAKLFPANKVFWCFGGKPVEQWMAQLVGCKALTGGATSVAHLNFTSAVWMGCSPIVFVGQDLSFSQSKSHSSDMALPIKDSINKLLKNDKDIVWLDGVHGEKVPSNRGFHSHKRYFETMIQQEKGHYINATEKGAHIEGTIVMPLQEAIDQFCTARIDTTKISDLSVKKNPEILRNHLITTLHAKIKKCGQIQKWLKQTELLLKDLFKIVNKNQKSKIKNSNALPVSGQKKLLKIDKIGKRLDNAIDIWPLMQEVTMAGLRQSEQQKHAIDLLGNDPDHYTKWLEKSLQRLDTINKVRKEVLPLFQDTLQEDVLFLESEAGLFESLDKQEDIEKYNRQLIQLVRLYFDAGNITLAKPWLEKLSKALPDSGEANFFQGITAAHYTEYEKAETFFKKACKADPAYIDQIENFRDHQGNAYIRYAPIFDINGKAVARRLLLKGLIYAPEHKKVMQALKLRGDKSLEEIKAHEKAGTLPEAEDMIDDWLDDLSAHQALVSIIGADHASQLHQYKGIILAGKEALGPAIELFKKALDIAPDNPELHIVLTNIYFARQDFSQGIYHLKQAVLLDSVYAVYWEEIGDELMNSGQFEDALSAFETCFLVLPERIHLLKKIGDCYQKTGQLEAAREAYTNLNTMLKKS
jgi:tetratricopeptide (TPR) repeat protein